MIRIFLILSLVFFLFPSNSFAQAVINELSSWETTGDWIELFAFENTDISGWILRDKANTPIETIPIGTIIGPSSSSFYVIEAGNRLNKESDQIKLLKGDDVTVVDSIIYGEADSPCAPGQGETIGRYPDANSLVDRFSNATKNSSNNNGTRLPCPTPTSPPSNTSVPTPTTKPTNTSDPTKKPSPTIRPTPKSEVKTAIAEETGEIEPTKINEGNREQVGSSYTNTRESPTPTPQVKGNTTNSFPYTAAFLIVLGLFFIGVSVFAFLRNQKKRYNFEDKEFPEDEK